MDIFKPALELYQFENVIEYIGLYSIYWVWFSILQ